jgi:hypothetical protein
MLDSSLGGYGGYFAMLKKNRVLKNTLPKLLSVKNEKVITLATQMS